MWFFTADLHLGHSNIIKYCRRPFMNGVESGLMDLVDSGNIPIGDVSISRESTMLMDDHIINRINSVVSANDNLVVVGDFCLTKSLGRTNMVKSFRDRINCRNVFLILGNHDDRDASLSAFKCFDHYLFNVNGQKIFACHYPCRSWERSAHGSWMVYGHVHGRLDRQDKTGMTSLQEESVASAIMEMTGDKAMCEKIIGALKKNRQPMMTLDVGVDNPHPSGVFGTPWSFDDIRNYMSKMS